MRFRLRNFTDKNLYPLTGLLKQIGRGMDCDIVIADPAVSRLHARLEKSGEGWVIVDLESRNGTKVNGESVREKILNPGDVIQIGGTSLKFEIDDQAEDPGESTRAGQNQAETPGVFSRLFPRKNKK
jgi:pSer/pThr/pTyr-binding forkhead associated (FHA) protein